MRASPSFNLTFSGWRWEWYDQGIGSLYLKRQGGTKASLKTSQVPDGHSMESLEFLEDTIFQVNVTPRAKPDTYTHELLIQGGSTLLLWSP
jgi:hypothetical protein